MTVQLLKVVLNFQSGDFVYFLYCKEFFVQVVTKVFFSSKNVSCLTEYNFRSSSPILSCLEV